jgi:hypothetical protein
MLDTLKNHKNNMTPLQFTIWLQGFLEAAGNNGLQQYQVNKITDTLNKVDYTPSYPTAYSLSNQTVDDKVPYSTICGCNPANGGSGICGCIMGNKLVPRDRKSNIYTTTSENTPFNWQYKDNKQILND